MIQEKPEHVKIRGAEVFSKGKVVPQPAIEIFNKGEQILALVLERSPDRTNAIRTQRSELGEFLDHKVKEVASCREVWGSECHRGIFRATNLIIAQQLNCSFKKKVLHKEETPGKGFALRVVTA